MSKMSKNEEKTKKTKTTRTYSINDSIYEEFSDIVSNKMFNKSKIIESLIKNWIEENK